jgi:hypothetical protein
VSGQDEASVRRNVALMKRRKEEMKEGRKEEAKKRNLEHETRFVTGIHRSSGNA